MYNCWTAAATKKQQLKRPGALLERCAWVEFGLNQFVVHNTNPILRSCFTKHGICLKHLASQRMVFCIKHCIRLSQIIPFETNIASSITKHTFKVTDCIWLSQSTRFALSLAHTRRKIQFESNVAASSKQIPFEAKVASYKYLVVAPSAHLSY